MAETPADLHTYVGKLELRGIRNYLMRVKIDSEVIYEVHGIWKECLKRDNGEDDAGKPYATLQKAPEVQQKYGLLGKLRQFLEEKVKGTGRTVQVFWAPDFAVYILKEGQQAQYIASVPEPDTISCGEDVADVVGMPTQEAEKQVSAIRRR